MSAVPTVYRTSHACADMAAPADPAATLGSSGQKKSRFLAARQPRNGQARRPSPQRWGINDLRHLRISAPLGTRPMRLRCFEYERPGRRRVERRFGEHLKRYPVQVRLPLPLQGEAAPQMLSSDHILQHRITIFPKAEYNEGLPEDRVLGVKGKNLQRYIWPVNLSRETLKLLIHTRLVTDPALQDRFIERN